MSTDSSPTNPTDSSEFSETEATERQEFSEASRRLATLPERFSAFFADSLILAYLLTGWFATLNYLLHRRLMPETPLKRPTILLIASTGIALYFLYYLVFEGVLTASPGKLLAHLRVRKKEGGVPSLLAIVVRNLLRLVDTPLFFLTGLPLMESTTKQQRLGDLLAGTVVMKNIPVTGHRLATDHLASATRRTAAFFCDLLWLLPLTYGLLLSIPVERRWPSLILLNFVPPFLLLVWSLGETFQITFGKTLWGLKVVDEEGRPATLAATLLRNSFRLLDTNPIGYLCAALSSKKQRPGDLAAGTLVVRASRGWKGWVALSLFLLFSVGVFVAGLKNPQGFIKKDYRVQFVSTQIPLLPESVERQWHREFRLEQLSFGFSEKTPNPTATFDPGTLIYLLTKLSGFQVKNGTSWIQADLRVRDSRKVVVLEKPNIVNASLAVGNKQYADIAIRFALNPQALPGRYEVAVTFKDLFSQQHLAAVGYFVVRSAPAP